MATNAKTLERVSHRKKCFNRFKSHENQIRMKSSGKHYKRITHTYYRRYINSNADKNKGLKTTDPRQFCQYITGKSKTKSEVSLNAFYDFMKTLNTTECEETETFLYNDQTEAWVPEQLDKPISTEEIKAYALNLQSGKSCGLDSILNEHIKSSLHLMLPTYHKLFNIILDTGKIPSSWTEGCIIPIYKKKCSKTDPENYRPTTLLSCLVKLFTAIINSRLQTFSNDFDIIQEKQTGFRKQYSTIDNVLYRNSKSFQISRYHFLTGWVVRQDIKE